MVAAQEGLAGTGGRQHLGARAALSASCTGKGFCKADALKPKSRVLAGQQLVPLASLE